MNNNELIHALRQHDENAFSILVKDYHASLVRTALIYVNSPAVAEEVVQDTWIGVLKGIQRFEARSSLKTWIFSILINRAKTYAVREGRYIPFDIRPDDASSVDPDRFHSAGHPLEDHWNTIPDDWNDIPEERLLSDEVGQLIQRSIDGLPAAQRQVITLRDIECLSSREVCDLLDLSEANQRVLLHRARSRVRQALEDYLKQ